MANPIHRTNIVTKDKRSMYGYPMRVIETVLSTPRLILSYLTLKCWPLPGTERLFSQRGQALGCGKPSVGSEA